MNNAATSQSKKKKGRTLKKNHLLDLPPECHLSKLPVELIAEILLYTKSPRDVLAVARSCKALCYTLLNETNQFIWRYCRENCKPEPLPEPVRKFTEPGYAAFVFNDSNCEVCGDSAPLMQGSHGLRLKLCRRTDCKNNLTAPPKCIITQATVPHFLAMTNVLDSHRDRPYFSTLPMVEASTCFLPMGKGLNGVQTWPQNPATFRTSDLTAALQEYLDESSTPERFEAYVQRCEARTRENHEYMKMCVALYHWKFKFENAVKTVKNGNEKIGQAIAKTHGIEYWDLQATPSFGGLLRAKNQSLEGIADIDYNVRQATINAELLKIKEQRGRRTHEETYRNARNSVAKHYNRLRAGRLEMPLPTLEVFRELPIIAQLQKNAKPNINLDNELKSSVITSLLHAQLEEWREKAMDHLLTLLGLPTGWKSASKNKLHPTQRVTARFRCGRCTRIEMRNREDECLDLAGVCAHTCEASKKGRIPQWKIENFVKDEKAIDAMKKVIALCDVNPEDSSSIGVLKAFGHKIVCQSCDAVIIMTPGNVVGHSHRHDDMQIRLTTNEEAESMVTHPPVQLAQKLLGMEKRAHNARKVVAFGCRHCVQRVSTPPLNDDGPPENSNDNEGNEELLAASSAVNPPAVTSTTTSGDGAPETMGNIDSGRTAADKGTSAAAPNSGSGAGDVRPTGVSTRPNKPPGLFNFDGLRSHLKAKHNVLNIRDEDLYCTQLEEVMKLFN